MVLISVLAVLLTPSARAIRSKYSQHGDVEMLYVPEGRFEMGGVALPLGMKAVGQSMKEFEKQLALDGKTLKIEGPWVRISDSHGGYSAYHNDEGPKREVTLDSYWIGKNLITVAQFRDFTRATRYKFDWTNNRPQWGWVDTMPMVMVTWDDARAYCKWAGGDLPTEAQYEKAARGTDGREFPWGDTWNINRLCADKQETYPIGSFPNGASPYGCLDMVGNAQEWCRDWYGKDYEDLSTQNPTGVEKGDQRVLRGGSFSMVASENFRCSWRQAAGPKARACVFGFRLTSN